MRKKHIRRYCFIGYNVHRYLKNNLLKKWVEKTVSSRYKKTTQNIMLVIRKPESCISERLKTPPQSTDINIIENIYDRLKRKIRSHRISSMND